MAVELGLPIVPLTIDGSYNVLPKSTLNLRPGKIKLTIHQPIVPDSDSDEEIIRLSNLSKQTILAGLKG